jgi:hypothetical protein
MKLSGKSIRCLCSLMLVVAGGSLRAEEITLDDGQVLSSDAFRRSGSSIMLRITTAQGGVIETGYPVSRIVRIAFAEPPELTRVMEASSAGNAGAVLSMTGDYVASKADFADIPGSWWPRVARIRLMALVASGKDAEAAELAGKIASSGVAADAPLAGAGALFGILSSRNPDAVIAAATPLTKSEGEAGALAQIALGRAFLLKKDYQGALRAFLGVRVFHPSLALLQPPALSGAADAYIGLKDEKRAILSLREIHLEYPDSPLAPGAKKREEGLPKP